jgi:hypothetical protein
VGFFARACETEASVTPIHPAPPHPIPESTIITLAPQSVLPTQTEAGGGFLCVFMRNGGMCDPKPPCTISPHS